MTNAVSPRKFDKISKFEYLNFIVSTALYVLMKRNTFALIRIEKKKKFNQFQSRFDTPILSQTILEFQYHFWTSPGHSFLFE